MGNVVDMPNKANEKKELSYEELQNAASQLSAQYQNLLAKYQELMEKHQELLHSKFFYRLEWLWKIINSDVLPNSFVEQCKEEFVTMMTPEESVEEETND